MGLDRAVEAILSQGGIWAALFIFSVALGSAVAVHLQGKLSQCWADRVTDGKATAEVLQANTVVMSQQVAENAARTRANEAMGRAQELSALQIQQLTAEVARLRDALGRSSIGS